MTDSERVDYWMDNAGEVPMTPNCPGCGHAPHETMCLAPVDVDKVKWPYCLTETSPCCCRDYASVRDEADRLASLQRIGEAARKWDKACKAVAVSSEVDGPRREALDACRTARTEMIDALDAHNAAWPGEKT